MIQPAVLVELVSSERPGMGVSCPGLMGACPNLGGVYNLDGMISSYGGDL